MRILEAPSLILGEGPVWDAGTGTLSWIDIDDGLVLSAAFDGDALGPTGIRHVGGPVGAAVPAPGGAYLIAMEAWLGLLHPDGRLEKSRALLPPNRRFNDGKVDPQGRFVVGTLRRFGGSDGRQQLLRLEHDGSITVLDDDLHLSNGLAWSPDGEELYSVDSILRVVHARSYAGGVAGVRRELVRLDGMPDGMTVDADGMLWVTQLDLHRIDCYAPDGRRVAERTLELPDGRHPASVEFAGPALDRLIITTGFPRLEDDADRALRAPGDGAVLVASTGSTGIAATPWAAAPLPPRERTP